MTSPIELRLARPGDASGIRDLYLMVAERSGGLARYADEISADYVEGFVAKSAAHGIEIVAATAAGDIVGELHCYSNGMRRFAHVWSALTVAVHPDTQGQGIGDGSSSACSTKCVTDPPSAASNW